MPSKDNDNVSQAPLTDNIKEDGLSRRRLLRGAATGLLEASL